MIEMQSNEQIYADMLGEVSERDVTKVQKLTFAWADAAEKAGNPNLRIVFLACVNTIGTMGPAYCRIAAATLMRRAKETENN